MHIIKNFGLYLKKKDIKFQMESNNLPKNDGAALDTAMIWDAAALELEARPPVIAVHFCSKFSWCAASSDITIVGTREAVARPPPWGRDSIRDLFG